MAERTLSVKILGDSRSLQREFAKSSRAASAFGRDVSRAGRGALVGTGALGGLGRAAAFASTAFIGGAGLTAAIRGAFGELQESRRVTAQTAAVLKSTGAVAGVTADQVDALGQALLRTTGIDDEAIRSAENLLLTFTNVRNQIGEGNNIFTQATSAILDMSVAMGSDLESATIRVGKALQDPVKGVTALRRVGVLLTKQQEQQIRTMVKAGDTIGAQRLVLAELTREFGGSAAAAGRVQPWNLLRETIRNLSAEIAEGFLPQIINTTQRLQHWLDNAENVDRIKNGFREFGNILQNIGNAAQDVARAFGGWRNALVVLIGAWAGFKAAGIAAAIQVQTANIVAAGVTASAWKAALISTGWGAFAVAAGIAAAAIITNWEDVKRRLLRIWLQLQAGAVQAALAIVEPFTHIPEFLGGLTGKARDAAQSAKETLRQKMQSLRNDFNQLGRDSADEFAKGFKSQFPDVGPGMTLDIPLNTPTPRFTGGGATGGGITASQRNQFFDAATARQLNRVQDVDLRRQLSLLDKIAASIESQIAKVRDITRKLKLRDDLLEVQRQRRQVQQQITDNFLESLELGISRSQMTRSFRDDLAAVNAALAAVTQQIRVQGRTNELESRRLSLLQQQASILDQQRAAAEEVARNRADANKARQFRTLGLTSTGDQPVAGVRALQRRLRTLRDQVRGTFLDTPKTGAQFKRIARVLAEGPKKVGRDVRSAIQQMFRDINDALKQGSGTLTKFHKTSANALLTGLGLSPDQVRALRSRLSQVGAGGTVHASGFGAFGTALNVNGGTIVVNHTSELDGQVIERSTTKHQQRRRRRNPPQKRGVINP